MQNPDCGICIRHVVKEQRIRSDQTDALKNCRRESEFFEQFDSPGHDKSPENKIQNANN